MIKTLLNIIQSYQPAPRAYAHCDGPCGVYDPAQARVGAEAVLSMTKKILDLTMPAPDDTTAMVHYQNTLTRYIVIKEEQAHKAKEDILVLWTDYFKPEHLEKYPNLHELVWNATKNCSTCKQEVNLEAAEELMKQVEEIHNIFWETKGKQVEWYMASA